MRLDVRRTAIGCGVAASACLLALGLLEHASGHLSWTHEIALDLATFMVAMTVGLLLVAPPVHAGAEGEGLRLSAEKSASRLAALVCRDCSGKLSLSPYKHTQQVGCWTITESSTVWQCLLCHTPQLSLDDLHAFELRAARAVLSAGKLDGAVFKYARKALGLTQKELGAALSCAEDAVTQWEAEKEPIPTVAALRLLGLFAWQDDDRARPRVVLAADPPLDDQERAEIDAVLAADRAPT